ncbi:Phage prohead protease, HK97 family [Neorhizobium galegae bv. officinalis]|nr:Phage prohead protease, HK97 family [Neorhizobium galegae bv. officinalis]
MMERETRSFSPAEIRAVEGTVKVSGYAAVFNQETDIGGYYREVIEPGAFAEALGRDDVVFLINHDGLPLARTRSGTLKLSEDAKGLFMEAELDAEDPDVKAIVPKMKRGDLDKMSFAFWPDVHEWDDTQNPPLRSIKKVRLFDVSIVTTPAYDGTEIGLRSLQEHRASAQNTLSSRVSEIRRRMKGQLARRLG